VGGLRRQRREYDNSRNGRRKSFQHIGYYWGTGAGCLLGGSKDPALHRYVYTAISGGL
jgi:hypothetical protein